MQGAVDFQLRWLAQARNKQEAEEPLAWLRHHIEWQAKRIQELEQRGKIGHGSNPPAST